MGGFVGLAFAASRWSSLLVACYGKLAWRSCLDCWSESGHDVPCEFDVTSNVALLGEGKAGWAFRNNGLELSSGCGLLSEAVGTKLSTSYFCKVLYPRNSNCSLLQMKIISSFVIVLRKNSLFEKYLLI